MKNYFFSLKIIFRSLLVALVVTSLNCADVSAQQKPAGEISKTYRITLNDGSVITGILLSSSEGEVILESPAMGEIRLERSGIKSMVQITAIDEKKSGIWFSNPNPSKYFLGPSAIPPKKGTGYYQNSWIFINSASVAITNNISITGGIEIMSLLAKGEGPYVFFINPKVSFKIAENFYAGGNILYLNSIRTIEEFGGLATLNGFFTYGNHNNNITAGAGWGFAEGEFTSRPLITASGMVRVSRRIAFVTENWIAPIGGEEGHLYGVFSYGIRFLGEKNSVDLGFLNNKDLARTLIIGIPILDFVINF